MYMYICVNIYTYIYTPYMYICMYIYTSRVVLQASSGVSRRLKASLGVFKYLETFCGGRLKTLEDASRLHKIP